MGSKETDVQALQDENRALRHTVARLKARIAALEAGGRVKPESEGLSKLEDRKVLKAEDDNGVAEHGIAFDDELAAHGNNSLTKRPASPPLMPTRHSTKKPRMQGEAIIARAPNSPPNMAKTNTASNPPKVGEKTDSGLPLGAAWVAPEAQTAQGSRKRTFDYDDGVETEERSLRPEGSGSIFAGTAVHLEAQPKRKPNIAGAPAHFNMDARETTTVDKSWLKDTVLKPARVGMHVRLHGTRGGGDTEEWDGGTHEGREGIVQSVLELAGGFHTTARVLFADESQFPVPICYLVPVPPNCIGDTVVALDGKFKGHALKVRDEGAGDAWVVSEDDSRFDEIPEGQLVKVTERPMGYGAGCSRAY